MIISNPISNVLTDNNQQLATGPGTAGQESLRNISPQVVEPTGAPITSEEPLVVCAVHPRHAVVPSPGHVGTAG